MTPLARCQQCQEVPGLVARVPRSRDFSANFTRAIRRFCSGPRKVAGPLRRKWAERGQNRFWPEKRRSVGLLISNSAAQHIKQLSCSVNCSRAPAADTRRTHITLLRLKTNRAIALRGK